MKEKFNNLSKKKEAFDVIWSNRRYRGLIKLSFWFVFILFLSLLVRTNGDGPIVPDGGVVYKSDIKSLFDQIYSYNMVIDFEGTDNYVLRKRVYYNRELVNFNDNIYYYDNKLDSLTPGVDSDFVSWAMFFNISNIYSLISEVDEEYVTNYNDGSRSANYKVLDSSFFEAYGNSFLFIDEFIDITIFGSNQLNSVIISLGDNEIDFGIKRVNITLSDVNGIDGLNIGSDI